jgi:hypothetical protein
MCRLAKQPFLLPGLPKAVYGGKSVHPTPAVPNESGGKGEFGISPGPKLQERLGTGGHKLRSVEPGSMPVSEFEEGYLARGNHRVGHRRPQFPGRPDGQNHY